MEEVHIEQVWDLLQEKFGFPKKTWRKAFNEHLDKQPKKENDLEFSLNMGMIK